MAFFCGGSCQRPRLLVPIATGFTLCSASRPNRKRTSERPFLRGAWERVGRAFGIIVRGPFCPGVLPIGNGRYSGCRQSFPGTSRRRFFRSKCSPLRQCGRSREEPLAGRQSPRCSRRGPLPYAVEPAPPFFLPQFGNGAGHSAIEFAIGSVPVAFIECISGTRGRAKYAGQDNERSNSHCSLPEVATVTLQRLCQPPNIRPACSLRHFR